ncbi:MAG: DnaJ domain-containing protein [Bacteroidetes bacterium]|nr:DnaJ domain-containing protein [Bacteroidota bacterium]MCL2303063.1 DnaJ domain-containing protein [Lentimicrobiaceae bacterium]
MFKFIGAFLGWLLTERFWGVLLGFIIGSFIDSARRAKVFIHRRTTSRDDFIKTLLIFTTVVVKSDNGKMLRSELDFIRTNLLRILGPEKTQEALLVLRDMLNQEFDVLAVAQQFGRNSSIHEKLMMLQFLFGLAATDGTVDPAEMEAIRFISNGMGISDRDFESLKAMFFGWQGNFGGGGYTGSSAGYRPSYNIETDYKVLEIEPSATDDEVKKAYRIQAMKHHPDKVNHLGDEIRKAAEERFTKLNESYERIKKARGMN